MIRATFHAAAVRAADGAGRRTVSGTAVPWGVPGVVSDGTEVVFEAGSIDPTARPVLLLHHDRARPIGAVIAAADTGTGLDATARVSATAEGDDALVLAADGALPMFSIGAEPTDWTHDAAGVLHVRAAIWRELSLLTIGAYDAARVQSVTATRPEAPVLTMSDEPVTPDPPQPDQPAPDQPDPDEAIVDDDDDTVTPDGAVIPGQAQLPLVPVTAGRSTRRAAARHPYADVGLADLSRLLLASMVDPRAASRVLSIMTSPGARSGAIEAALTDVTLVGTNNVGPNFRPGYQAELVDIVSHGSPIVDAVRQGDLQRGDYPNKTFNAWTKTPVVAEQVGEKTPINSGPVAIGPTSVPVKTWATGNDLSQQLLDFGSPSFVEDYIRAAGVDYAEVIDAYAAGALMAIANDVPTVAGDSFVAVIGKLFGGLDPTKVPPGGLFLAVSWDVWVGMMGITVNDGPAFWNGNISFGSVLPTADVGGLSVIVSTSMPAASYLLGLRNGATWYDLPGTPFSLRAVNVGNLGLDVAVYGYGALGIQFPGAFAKTTVPAAAP